MSRSTLKFFEFVPPISGTSADTILDLAGRNISDNRRRDYTAARSRQDRHVHLGAAPFLSRNLHGGDRTSSREENVA